MFDAAQEHEDAWKNTLEGWNNDPYGPQVDVSKEFIENMSNRMTVMQSYDTPITENSERAMFAIEATNEKALAKTLEKWMANESDVVKRHQVGQYVIYERTSKETVGAGGRCAGVHAQCRAKTKVGRTTKSGASGCCQIRR